MSETDDCSDLLTKLQQLAERVNDVKEACTDEAKTRSYLVEPLLEALGYDCRDPRDVISEFTADVADKKGEKVDYALMRDGEPVVLVEAKTLGNRLGGREREQLQRYFPFTPARLAVITDGVQWHWYKGRSERDQSHQMGSSPFLTYDVRDPSESAAEWLTQIIKDRFNRDELLRISRRIEFTERIVNWIDRTLVNPTEAGAVQLNEVVGLDASSQETPLAVDAIRSAWAQVVSGRNGVPVQEANACAESAVAVESVNTHDAQQSTSADSQSPSIDSSEDSLTLRFISRWDDRLEIGNGKVLDAKSRPRAWRMAEGDWVVKDDGTLATSSVLGALLRCDQRRFDEEGLAAELGLRYASEQPSSDRFRIIPGFSKIYWNCDRNNNLKAEMLERIASKIQFVPPPDSPLADVPHFEWWLPQFNP